MENNNKNTLDNKYEIIDDEFGVGGTAIVKIVKKILSENLYAAKIYYNPEEISKYITNEINILKYITEKKIPYITNYIDDGKGPLINDEAEEEEDKKYLILEYAPKGELLNYIYFPQKGFKEIYSKMIFQKILESIKALHNLGICHRDLKSDNIILDDNFNPKICDFGYSIHYEDKNNIKPNRQKIGDKSHIPPQMYYNQPYNTFKADIFNLGVILFYIITGKFGFESSNKNNEKYNYIKEHKFEQFWNTFEIDENIKNLSPEFKNLYFKIVSYNEEERPSIDEILNDEWFNEIRNLDSNKYKELNDKLIEDFFEREKIYIENSQIEVETDIEDETSAGYNNLDNETIKKEYFSSNISPKKINLKSIKNMKNFIKIIGNLKPNVFMNYLANKIESKNIYEIQESQDSLEFDLIYEKEEEDDNDDGDNSNNEEEDQDIEYIPEKKIIIQVKLLETEKNEHYLKFMKKLGNLEEYYKILEDIIKETKTLL